MNENLDPAGLQRLQRLGNTTFVIQMIDLFIEYAGSKVAEARTAHAAGDLTGVQKAVHPIKSSAGNVGARRVQELAQVIEDLTYGGQSEDLTTSMADLDQAFAAAKLELTAKRLSLSAVAPPAS